MVIIRENLKAICIESVTTKDFHGEEFYFERMKIYYYEIGYINDDPNKKVNRFLFPDYKIVNCPLDVFSRYFSTEIIKVQRTEGLKKIGKVSKNNKS